MDVSNSHGASVSLKDGSLTTDSRLDRVDEKDPRSRDFSISALTTSKKCKKLRSYTWRPGTTLNQGHEGACVGFAWAHELSARPAQVPDVTELFAKEEIYFRAQKIDRFPGGAYPGAFPYGLGTSVLAGAKVLKTLGYIREYRWAFDLEDLVLAVGYMGPAVFGCTWHRKMNTPDEQGFVKPIGRMSGKHCILLYAVKINKTESGDTDLQNSYFTFQNSWGEHWGVGGTARLKFSDVQKLWDVAETCIPVSRSRHPNLGVKLNS